LPPTGKIVAGSPTSHLPWLRFGLGLGACRLEPVVACELLLVAFLPPLDFFMTPLSNWDFHFASQNECSVTKGAF
jgi:hypothetical protein